MLPQPLCGKCGKSMTPENARIRPELFLHDACLPDELKTRAMEPICSSQESPGPQTVEEARMFLEGVQSGLTRYAVAIGHSALKRENPTIAKLLDEAGWECIEMFEKLTGRII